MQSSTQPGSLADRFREHGAAPSDALWGQIEATLEEKEKKRRGFVWWWIGGASAAGMLILTILSLNKEQPELKFALVYSSAEKSQYHVAENHYPINLKDTAGLIQKEVSVVAPDNISQTEVSGDFQIRNNMNSNKGSNLAQMVNTEFQKEVIDQEDIDLLKNAETELFSFDAPLGKPACIALEKTERLPWEMGFHVSYWHDVNHFGPAKNLETDDQLISGPNNNLAFQAEALDGNNNPLGAGNVNRYINVSGFVGKYFSKRWSWRTGLDFSRMTFSSEYYSNAGAFPDAQGNTALSLLGIPVSVQCDFIQRSLFRLRGSISLINEVPVFERYETNAAVTKKFISGYMGGSQISLSNDIRLGKSMYLSISPAYRFYFVQYAKSGLPLVKKTHWLGGSIGLTWML